MSAEIDFIPAEAFPPGDYIREEIAERGWTQADLADILGKSLPLVNELIGGKRELTPETAHALASAFGTSAQFWLNLETRYRLYRTAQKLHGELDNVTRRARLYSKAPVKEMTKRGWIEPSSNIDVLERNVCDFLSIHNIDGTPGFAHAARKSAPYDNATPPLTAWLCRARQLAKAAAVVGKFTKDSVEAVVKKLQRLLPSAPEIRQVPQILSEGGIRFVVVETIGKAKVDGVTFWLDPNSPVIAMSLRYDRIDSFWFTLMHELVHVSRGDGKATLIIDDLDVYDDELPESERKVNHIAVAWLVPQDELDDFIARTRPLYSKVKIANFARRIEVHPGVVVGQLHHRKEFDFKFHRGFLEKIRDFITPHVLSDGFGFAPLPV
jgi:HTH-type transcriptional regulator/antitoxin HigA